MTPENEALLMKDIGALITKVDMMQKSNENITPRIMEVERKLNKHTGILAVIGSGLLFFKDKISEMVGV